MRITEVLKKNKYFVILAIISLVFLVVYSWLYINMEPKFTSPDEVVNYSFINLFAETGQLRYYEPLNEVFSGLVIPRNAVAIDGYIAPGSFLGMILLFGLAAKVFGSAIIYFLTPLFSVVGALFFYLLIKEIFYKRIAFISSLLLFITPPFWYYHSRGMFHNAIFIDFLIIASYFLVKFLKSDSAKSKFHFRIFMSGLFFGLALIVRTSEAIWVIGIIILVYMFSRHKFGWKSVLAFLIPIIIVFLSIFFLNKQLYGSPLSFGYSGTLLQSVSSDTGDSSPFLKIKQIIFPFKFNLGRIGTAFYKYLVLIFPWFSIFLILGIFWFLKNLIGKWLKRIFVEINEYVAPIQYKFKVYYILYLLMSVWLIIFYGSFEFTENINPNKIILSSSYIRYWLPIYVFGLPIVVLMIKKISNQFRSAGPKRAVLTLIIMTIIIFSVNKVLADPTESLYEIKKNISKNTSKARIIFENTDTESVIVSGFADKILFPQRKVVVSLPGDMKERNVLVSRLLTETNVYYYHNSLDKYSYSVIESLKNNGFKFKQVYVFIEDSEILYQLQ